MAKVDSKDIAILAGKWGITTEAANAYVKTYLLLKMELFQMMKLLNLLNHGVAHKPKQHNILISL
jgi:hypothetical protein